MISYNWYISIEFHDLNFVEKESFRINTRFTYSWLTNRIGNIWDILEHQCDKAHIKQTGVGVYSQSAFGNYASASAVSNVFHTKKCKLPFDGAIPSYPCADSYPGFSDEVDLDLGRHQLKILKQIKNNLRFKQCSHLNFSLNANRDKHYRQSSFHWWPLELLPPLGHWLITIPVKNMVRMIEFRLNRYLITDSLRGPKNDHRVTSYLITVFLALIFYLQLLEAEVSPAGNQDLPLVLWVLFATAGFLTYSLFETIFLATFDHSKPLPWLFQKFVNICHCCCKRKKIIPVEQTDLTQFDKDWDISMHTLVWSAT